MLIASLLLTVATAQAATNVEPGKQLFNGMCARCHGIDGTGDEGPSLNRPTLTRARRRLPLREVIRDGIPDRGMPRVRRLTDNELDQLVAYVRSLGRDGGVGHDAATRNKGARCTPGSGARRATSSRARAAASARTSREIGVSRGAAYLRQSFLGPAETLPRGSSRCRAAASPSTFRCASSPPTDARCAASASTRIRSRFRCRDSANRFHSFRKSDTKEIEKEFGKSLMPSFRGRAHRRRSRRSRGLSSNLRGGK